MIYKIDLCACECVYVCVRGLVCLCMHARVHSYAGSVAQQLQHPSEHHHHDIVGMYVHVSPAIRALK